ncbi:MAG: Glutathione import ATP-binding protein GsiA [Succiniclasticum sp.]|jgi:peptide/nickel transport system ATP-binding protein
MLLQVKDLSITYGNGSPTVQHVSFAVDTGEVLAIVGESGSGKTTVIRAIQMTLPANGRVSGGQILFRGRDLNSLSKEEQRALSGRDISMIFQDAGAMLNPIRTIGRQYREFLALHGITDRGEATARMHEMLRLVRLDPAQVAASYIHELSGGMRQRVGIAMAITFHPALLLGDEPTSALDVTTQAAIIRELMAVRQRMGMAIVIVTHNMGVASYMADRILVMKNGAVEEYGDAEQVLHHPRAAYTKMLLDAVPKLEDTI